MIINILDKIAYKHKESNSIRSLLEKLKVIRLKSDCLAIHPSPTGIHWLGIANATKSLYPEGSIEIPQLYSTQILTDKDIKRFCDEIIRLDFKKVILSGFPEYFFLFAENLSSSCYVQTLFHGTISEFHSPIVKKYIEKNITYCKKGIVNQFAFIKPGLAETFNRLYGFETTHCPLPLPAIDLNVTKLHLDKTKTHIGVFGADTFNKNLHNQIIHALLFKNTIIHVLDKSSFEYLQLNDRIIGHGNQLPRNEFLQLLASMDLNLYMSYNESWGLIAYESEALGVKCLMLDDIDYEYKISLILEKNLKS